MWSHSLSPNIPICGQCCVILSLISAPGDLLLLRSYKAKTANGFCYSLVGICIEAEVFHNLHSKYGCWFSVLHLVHHIYPGICRDMSWVNKTSEISLPKTMNMICTEWSPQTCSCFMPYYYWLDIDFNGLCIQFLRVYWWNSIIIIWRSNTEQKRFIAMSLCIVMYTKQHHYPLWCHNGCS